MCAIVAGQRGKSVLVLERGERIGAKILISGGGRCNFTNLHARPENYLSSNPDFCKSALARYKPEDFIALVERPRHRPTTRKSSASSFAITARAKSWRCCARNARRLAWKSEPVVDVTEVRRIETVGGL